MDQELERFVNDAGQIKKSGRWASMNQTICQLADNPGKHDVWEIQIFAGLCAQNFSEYLSLKKAYEDQTSEQSLLAWRTRNILEIFVWSRYCAFSKENARVFYEDAGRDVVGIHKSFIDWGKKTDQEAEWFDPIEAAKQHISKQAALKGIESLEGSYKKVHKAAEELGIGQHFSLSYKMLSKFSHPTAMLIMAIPDRKKEMLQKDKFYSDGCMYFVGAFTALEGAVSLLSS